MKNKLRAGVDRQAPFKPIKKLFANANSNDVDMSVSDLEAAFAAPSFQRTRDLVTV